MTHVEAAVRAVDELIERRERGDILIFMPTEQDIRETCKLLTGRFREEAAILPLFSRLTTGEQQRVFRSLTVRKIVVATNVAETSITIPGIRYVIDTGLARISQYNPRSRTAGLPVRAISRSSADQRKGRCGRVQNGICIRLYAEEDYLGRPLYTPPEILRSNLAGVILRMLALQPRRLSMPSPSSTAPPQRASATGSTSFWSSAPSNRRRRSGRRCHPSLAPDGTGADHGPPPARSPDLPDDSGGQKEGCLTEIVVIAAALSIQDPRERPAEKEAQADQAHKPFKDPASDFFALLSLWRRCFGRDKTTEDAKPLAALLPGPLPLLPADSGMARHPRSDPERS